MLQFLICGAIAVAAAAAGGSMSDPLPELQTLWDFDKPADSEKRFRELRPAAVASGDRSYRLELETQIARALGLQGRFDEAHRVLDEVDKELSAAPAQELTVPRIRLLLERGRAYNSGGARGKARPLFLQAWDLARATGHDFYAVDAAHMMGIIEPPDEQLAWDLKAMEVAERSTDPRARGWLGSLYNNIGMTWLDKGEPAKALASFEKGLEERKKQGSPKKIRIARWTVALALRKLGRIEEALRIQNELLSELKKEGAEEDGFVEEEIGECLLAHGRPSEATPHFRRAVELLRGIDWVRNDLPRWSRLERLAGEGSHAQEGAPPR